jgi:NAD(P)-dependent dehydrogenase (short-subunit alcohol dehydrogenase family)
VGEITVSVVGSKNPNWFDTHGVMNVTRAVLPVMRRQRSGHLFTMASMGGYLGGSRGTAYAASKFAVAGFTESLALELEEFGIPRQLSDPDTSAPIF